MDQQDHKVQLVLKVLKAQQVLKDHKVYKVLKV